MLTESYVSAINVKCLLFLFLFCPAILASRIESWHMRKHCLHAIEITARTGINQAPNKIVMANGSAGGDERRLAEYGGDNTEQ